MRELCGKMVYSTDQPPINNEYYGFGLRYVKNDNNIPIELQFEKTENGLTSTVEIPVLTPKLSLEIIKEKVNDDQWIDESKLDETILNSIMSMVKPRELTPSTNPELDKLVMQFLHCANNIAVNTRRGAGNLIYVNKPLFKILTELKTVNKNEETGEVTVFNGIDEHPIFNKAEDGSCYMLNACIKLKVKDFGSDEPTAIISYVGTITNDGGLIIVEDEINNRYAVVDNILDTDKYYCVIKLKV